MTLQFEVNFSGLLSQEPSAFKQSVEQDMAAKFQVLAPEGWSPAMANSALPTSPAGASDSPDYNPAPDCDQSAGAILPFAQQVVRNVPGASYDGDESNTGTLHFRDGFYRAAYLLAKAGYYVGFPVNPSGLLAYNPLQHAGGLEFRTYGSPGFHFKLVYPGWVGRIFPTTTIGAGSTANDLHIDCHNPVGSGFDDALKHFGDFLDSNGLNKFLPKEPYSPFMP